MSKSQVKFKVILQRVQGHSVRLSQVLRIHIQWLYFPVALSMCFSCMWMVNLARHNFLLPKCASFWRQSVWQMTTSSSAVAKRPHDALCLSVVSFSSTIPQVQFFYQLLWLRIYQCIQFDTVLLSMAQRRALLSYTRFTDDRDCVQRKTALGRSRTVHSHGQP